LEGDAPIQQLKLYCDSIVIDDIRTVGNLIMGCIPDEKEVPDVGRGKKKAGKKDTNNMQTEATPLYDLTDTTSNSEAHVLHNNAKIMTKLINPMWNLLHDYSDVHCILF
jgi:hypothetical protein